jgi:hypothetical protein
VIIAPHACNNGGDINTDIIADIIAENKHSLFMNTTIKRNYRTRGEYANKDTFDYNSCSNFATFDNESFTDLSNHLTETCNRFGKLLVFNIHGCFNSWAKRNKDVDVSIGVGFPDRLTCPLSTSYRFTRCLNKNGLSAKKAPPETKIGAYNETHLNQYIKEMVMAEGFRRNNTAIMQLEIKMKGNRETVEAAKNCASKIRKAIDLL